jgi:hypothetical protein
MRWLWQAEGCVFHQQEYRTENPDARESVSGVLYGV